MTVLGFVLIGIAVVWLCYKLYVAYHSGGGTSMMVPVYDAAVYPPMMSAFGAYWVVRWLALEWPIWAFIVIWVVTTALAAGAIRLAEELGDRPL